MSWLCRAARVAGRQQQKGEGGEVLPLFPHLSPLFLTPPQFPRSPPGFISGQCRGVSDLVDGWEGAKAGSGLVPSKLSHPFFRPPPPLLLLPPLPPPHLPLHLLFTFFTFHFSFFFLAVYLPVEQFLSSGSITRHVERKREEEECAGRKDGRKGERPGEWKVIELEGGDVD